MAYPTDAALLARAVAFDGGLPALINGRPVTEALSKTLGFHEHVIIQRAGTAWVIVGSPLILTRQGHWLHPPMPSSQIEAFLESTRFPTAREAVAFWEHFREAERVIYAKIKDDFLDGPELWGRLQELVETECSKFEFTK